MNLPNKKSLKLFFLFLFVILSGFFCYVFLKMNFHLGTNALSRIISIERFVETGTFVHKNQWQQTKFELSNDMVKIGDNYYSSKPPTYPLLLAVQAKFIYWLTKKNFFENAHRYINILVFLNHFLPILGFLCLYAYSNLLEDDTSWFALLFLLLAFTWSNLGFAYAFTVNNHTFTALWLSFSYFLLHRYHSKSSSFIAGLMCGFAVSNDFPMGVFCVLYLVIAYRQKPIHALAFLAASLLPILATLYFYYDVTGSIRPFYLNKEAYMYKGSYWNQPQGFDTLQDLKWTYFVNITIGHHGFFSINPVNILLLAAGIVQFRNSEKENRWKIGGILLASLLVSFWIWKNTNNYGGDCIGIRWLIPLQMIWLVAFFPQIKIWSLNPIFMITASILLLLSIYPTYESIVRDPFIHGAYEKWWMKTFMSN